MLLAALPVSLPWPCGGFLAGTYLWDEVFHIVWLPKPRVEYVMGGAGTGVIPVIENWALQVVCEQIYPAGKGRRRVRGEGVIPTGRPTKGQPNSLVRHSRPSISG